MASSGTYVWTMSNGETVLEAYERIQVRATSIRQEHMVSARRALNLLLVEASNRQVNLWKVQQNSFPLVQGTALYNLPANTVLVLDAWVSSNTGTQNQTDIYITPISRTEYATFSNKQTPGRPTSWWMDRLISPTLTVWPVPDASGPYVFNYFSCVQMQDANLPGGETPDLPFRWLDWFAAALAHRLSRYYAPTLEAARKEDAKEAWIIAASQDVEPVALALSPTLRSYYRR
jgi:hypothetical protein